MGKDLTKSELRKRAEEYIDKLGNAHCESIDPDEVKDLLHELEVYQIELEMQNETLRSAQLEIDASRRKYSDLYDYAPVGYFTFDQIGLILEANLTGASLLGIERQHLMGKPFLHYVAPASRSNFQAYLHNLLTSSGKELCELVLLRGWNEPFFAQLESVSNSDDRGEAVRIRSIVTDISDRKKLEEERNRAYEELESRVKERTRSLLAANERIAAVLSSITDAYLSLDSDWRIIEINSTAAGIFRREPGEFIGKSIWDEYPLAQKSEFFKKCHLAVESGRPVHFETATSTSGWFEFHAYPMENRLDIYFRDINDRKRSEEELNRRAIDLEVSNKELESFTYSVSHDLQSPLRAINGFTNMILNDYGKSFDKELQRKFDVIRTNAIRMGQLIEDLLALSRLGRRDLRYEPIEVKDIVLDTWREIKDSGVKQNIEFNLKDFPSYVGDRSLIRQVINNLLSNAVKFTRDRKPPVIEVGGYSENGECIFYVKDNGTGFDMQYHDKLFGVFQRLHGPEFPGTGIGLAIVHQIITRHGGKVWAEAKEDHGATFYFSLPCKDPAAN